MHMKLSVEEKNKNKKPQYLIYYHMTITYKVVMGVGLLFLSIWQAITQSPDLI